MLNRSSSRLESTEFILAPIAAVQAMKVVFELDYRELMAVQGATLHGDAAGENATATSKIFMRSLLRRLASALGLAGQFSAAVLDLVALELSKLRPLGDPRHSLRSAQVSLLPYFCLYHDVSMSSIGGLQTSSNDVVLVLSCLLTNVCLCNAA